MIIKAAEVIKKYPKIKKLLRIFYHSWIPEELSKEAFLEFFNSHLDKIIFIQIGSNNGKSNDPIYKYIVSEDWSGAVIEPVGYLYEELKNTYDTVSEKLFFVNAAISKVDGTARFYSIKQSNDTTLPEWYTQLGSFNKDVILKHKPFIPNIENLIEEVTVKSLSFETLRKLIRAKHVNLLHVDTEGYDYEILKLIDWKTFRPEVVIYEQMHLNSYDYKSSINLMKNSNYKVFSSNGDAICINRDLYKFYLKSESSK